MKKGEWTPADGLILEPSALVATKETINSLALTAGPGAGKTEMLAQRADFLLRTGLCRFPRRILAISFKVDASANLKERVRRRCGSSLAARFDSHTFHAFSKRIIDRFRLVLKGPDALNSGFTIGPDRIPLTTITFNDLVPLATQILESSKLARNAIRQTYTDVFLDEFQDCTTAQYNLIKAAFLGTNIRLVAVGDTKQKIMGWAGALEGIFVSFAADFRATPLNLYRNFRSKALLLRMQNEIIRVIDPPAVMPDELISGNEGIIETWKFQDAHDEAKHIADKVEEWTVTESIPYGEIAVLVSKLPDAYTEFLIRELRERLIPCRNEQELQDLVAEPIVQLVIDYLLVLYGDREPDAYIRLITFLSESLPEDEEVLQSRESWNRWIQMERSAASQTGQDFEQVWNFVRTFLQKVGVSLLSSLSPDYTSLARLKELLKNIKRRIQEAIGTSGGVKKALSLLVTGSGVRIMTIHKSKGLEFDTVVLLGVEREAFFGKPADERCVFFVGVSRAKRRLILTYSERRQTPTVPVKRWSESRKPLAEFLEYAAPFQVEALE